MEDINNMEVIFNEEGRIIVGCIEEGWVTIVQVLGNGATSKLLFPQRILNPVEKWLWSKQKEILETKSDSKNYRDKEEVL